jgi:hypothetical protein
VIRRSWPALVLVLVVMALAPATSLAARPTSITHALDFLHAKQCASGGFSASAAAADPALTPWVVMAIAAAHENQAQWRSSDGKTPIATGGGAAGYLQSINIDEVANGSQAQSNAPATYAKFMLAYVAAGRSDLVSHAGSGSINLRTKLLSYQDLTDGHFSPLDPGKYAAVNTTTWAVLALKAIGENGSAFADAVAWLRRQQGADGGFPSEPGKPDDIDDTAAAIQALRAGGVGSGSQVVTDALAYLHARQRADGGFPDYPSDGRSYAESTAWVIQALIATGQDPQSWNKGSHTPLTFLRGLQVSSGAFQHRSGLLATALLTTSEATIALSDRKFPFEFTGSGYKPRFRPHFSSVSPKPGAVLRTTRYVQVRALYADNPGGTGIDTGKIGVTVDTHSRRASAHITSRWLTLSISGLANGTHTIVVRVPDRSGNVATVKRTLTVSVPTPSSTPTSTPTATPTVTPTTPGPTPSTGTTLFPSPAITPTSTGSPLPGVSPASGVTGIPLSPSPGASPSSSPGAPAGGTGSSGHGSRTGDILGASIAALLPLGALVAYLGWRRNLGLLSGAGRGRTLGARGTPWMQFKTRLFTASHVAGLPRR